MQELENNEARLKFIGFYKKKACICNTDQYLGYIYIFDDNKKFSRKVKK